MTNAFPMAIAGKNQNVKKRSKTNHRRTVEAVENAWTSAQSAGLEMYHRGEASEGPWRCLRRLLRHERPLQIQERKRSIRAKAASIDGAALGGCHGDTDHRGEVVQVA